MTRRRKRVPPPEIGRDGFPVDPAHPFNKASGWSPEEFAEILLRRRQYRQQQRLDFMKEAWLLGRRGAVTAARDYCREHDLPHPVWLDEAIEKHDTAAPDKRSPGGPLDHAAHFERFDLLVTLLDNGLNRKKAEAEAARLLGCSERTVRDSFQRIKRALRDGTAALFFPL